MLRSEQNFEGGVNLSERPVPSTRQNERNLSSNTTSSPLLSPFTNEPNSDSTLYHAGLRGKNYTISGLHRVTELVDYQHEQMERESIIQQGNQLDNRVRCISDRMGSNMLSSEDRRSMVENREEDAHKLLRTAGRNYCSSYLCKKQGQNIITTAPRQHHSSGIYQQFGWDSIQGVSHPGKGSLHVVSGEKHPHNCSTHSGEAELSSRHRKLENDGPFRLEIEPYDFQEDRSIVWPTRSGPLCLQADKPTTEIFQLETRPLCNNNSCPSPGLENSERICQSTLVQVEHCLMSETN